MKAFVVRCEYEDGDSYEWPRFVVLGKRADVLADRMIEYAESISSVEGKQQLSAIEIRPFDVHNWLAMQESTGWVNQFFVAIAGTLNGEECSLLDRAVALSGQHCVVVADMHTPLQPAWQSVIHLPPHRSWDAQWAWGIRVVLDVLLEAAVQRGLICFSPEDIRVCLEGRYSELAVAHAEGEDRAVLAVEKVLQALSGRMDLALAEALILTFHAGLDISMREIHLGSARLKDVIVREDATIMVDMVWAEDNRFAVSLIASAPFA